MNDIVINTDVLQEDGSPQENTVFKGWTPIGNSEMPYSGTFDGQGNTIRGLYCKDGESYNVGLFGCAQDASISNVHISDSYFYGGSCVGGIVGRCKVNSENTTRVTITNCSNRGSVSGSGYSVGGVAGDDN